LNEPRESAISFIEIFSELKEQPSYFSLLQQDVRKLQDEELVVTNESKSTSDVPKMMNENDFKESTLKQIMIWLPITLVLVLWGAIMLLAGMPIQKNSILYAKYGTTKTAQLNH
jgi:hypothetical protein